MKKYCSSCGAVTDAQTNFCTNCGGKLTAFGEDIAPASPAVSTPVPAAAAPVTPAPAAPASPAAPAALPFGVPPMKIEDETPAGIGEDEYLDMLGSKWMVSSNEVIKGRLKGENREQIVVTDRRLYFNTRKWVGFSKETTESKINLEDVSATTIVSRAPSLLYILSFILCGIIAWFLYNQYGTYENIGLMYGAIFFAIIGISCLCVWLLGRRTQFRIEYSAGSGGIGNNGSMSFDVKRYNMETVRDFQKRIHAAKDQMGRR